MALYNLTPAQCRMARADCRISQRKPAAAAIVPTATLADFEAGIRAPYEQTLRDIREALEAKRATFHFMLDGQFWGKR